MEEVEAKFTIPDRDTLDRLSRIVRLGPFVPGDPLLRTVQDSYLDTEARDLYQHEYACRLRVQGRQRILTIKGLGASESAIHRRVESELVLPEGDDISPESWPDDSSWAQARAIVGTKSLQVLFSLYQVRSVRDLRLGDRLVGELSIDEVRIEAGGRQQSLWIAEVELLADGTMDDLYLVVDHLSGTWGLVPETTSKFHRGLALLDQADVDSESDQGRLSTVEREQLESIVAQAGGERVRKRAQLILGWAQGVAVSQLLTELNGSRSWAYGWLARFRAVRMAIFPRGLLEKTAPETLPSVVPEALPAHRVEMTVAEMIERFQVDVAHARCVAQHAVDLFDVTAEIHGLGTGRRRLLEIMGMLHNVGLTADPNRHDVVGRDIILDHDLEELSDVEQRMLAAAVYLHRKKVKRRRLETGVVAGLATDVRKEMLILVALLRMADGLDYTQGQTSTMAQTRATPSTIHIVVSGPSAKADMARAQAKADLWDTLFDVPVFFSVAEAAAGPMEAMFSPAGDSGLTAGLERLPALKSPGVVPDDPMGEAGRKVLRFHFLRMLEHEQGTRAGDDIEELHDMRVATRRMRAAFRVFAPYYRARIIRPHLTGLRRTARLLGAVRDLDVLMFKAESYLGTLPQGREQDLEPLLCVWRTQRDQSRDGMLAYLDSAKYGDFRDGFWSFLEAVGEGVRSGKSLPPRPVEVRHVLPALVYKRWGRVRAFDPILEGASVSTLHSLRIECKQLRYVLEFFRETLGVTVNDVIPEVVKLQDHLGDLNDANVANSMLSEFLFRASGTHGTESLIAPGVVSYLATKQRELQGLLETFPQTWANFGRPDVKHWLAEAIAYL